MFSIFGLQTEVKAGPCDNPNYVDAQEGAWCSQCCDGDSATPACLMTGDRLNACGVSTGTIDCSSDPAADHCAGHGGNTDGGSGGGCTQLICNTVAGG